MRVGRLGDVQAAKGIIAQAVYSGLRQVDIMGGLIAPLLYISEIFRFEELGFEAVNQGFTESSFET